MGIKSIFTHEESDIFNRMKCMNQFLLNVFLHNKQLIKRHLK